MTKKNILIVEDNLSNMRLAKLLLSKCDYHIETAVDAESALTLLETYQPDLILMDIQLPGMDGLELTKQLKKDPKTKKVRIIAVTAYAMQCDREKAMEAGCDGYISKPYDKRHLLLTIETFLK